MLHITISLLKVLCRKFKFVIKLLLFTASITKLPNFLSYKNQELVICPKKIISNQMTDVNFFYSVFATSGANLSAYVTRTSAMRTPRPSPRTGPPRDSSGRRSSSWPPCSPSWQPSSAPSPGGAAEDDGPRTTTIRNRRRTWNRVRRCLILFPWMSSRWTVRVLVLLRPGLLTDER